MTRTGRHTDGQRQISTVNTANQNAAGELMTPPTIAPSRLGEAIGAFGISFSAAIAFPTVCVLFFFRN